MKNLNGNSIPIFACVLVSLFATPANPLLAQATTPAKVGIQMLGDPVLQPGATLEFRFPEAMVDTAALGPAATIPVEFTPPIPGTFTWLSTQSGVFSPAAPLPLGGTWNISPAAAVDVDPGFRATVTTPDMQATRIESNAWDNENVPTTVVVKLAFNADISLESAKGLFEFHNTAGVVIPGVVRFARPDDYFSVDLSQEPWAARWQAMLNPGASPDRDPDAPFPARLIITSSEQLTTNSEWTFVMKPGLESADGTTRIDTPIDIPLGRVQPLRVTASEASNFINSGTTLKLQFNRPIAPDITNTNAAEFFTVSPTVPELKISVDWSEVVVRGEFELGKPYTITPSPEVVGADGMAMEGDNSVTFQFAPVAPRVYLPEITTEQLQSGRREFPYRAININQLQVTAKRIAADDLPLALTNFSAYVKSTWDENEPDEIFLPVDPNSIPGTVIHQSSLDITPTIDQPVTGSVNWTQILGANQPGTVFLTLDANPIAKLNPRRPGAQAIIQVTDLGILWKHEAGRLLVHVFSLKSGAPVASATATLFDKSLAKILESTSDASGQARLDFSREPTWLVVKHGDDAIAIPMGLGARELPVWSFGVPTRSPSWTTDSQKEPNIRGILFTDRPIYRGGETIHIKGIVREVESGQLKDASGVSGRLILLGPRGDELETTNIESGDDGGFSTSFTAPGIERGEYRIVFIPGTENTPWWSAPMQTTFLVADYQPDAFEVTLDVPADVPAGVTVPNATVTGAYLFGGALDSATVLWTIRSGPMYFRPPGFDDFTFSKINDRTTAPFTQRGDGKLQGDRLLNIPLQLPDLTGMPSETEVTVEVTDLNQQTVSTTRTFRRDAAKFYLGIAPIESRVIEAGQSIEVRAIAVQPDGTPNSAPVPYTAEIFLRRNDVARVQGAGNSITFQRSESLEPVAKLEASTLIPTLQGDQWKASQSDPLTIQVSDPGGYLVRLTATDPDGRPVVTESEFYVSGPGEFVWDYRNPSQIDLIPDKAVYHPGDTAKILLKNPIPGRAYVSVEQGSAVSRTFEIDVTGNAPLIEIPITASESPNVFVSVIVLRGADASLRKFPAPDFRFGLCNLIVQNPDDSLEISIKPESPNWTPGETIRASIAVRDPSGKPINGASVTFFAVDDGVLSLTGYERPDPLSVFQATLPLEVSTGITLTSLLPEDPDALMFSNKGYLIGGGGIGGAGMKFRDDFPSTIAWMPDLKTNADGLIDVEVPAPDAITRYRLIAVASSNATRFGSAESSITISKPLMLLSGLGSTANVGDTIIARVVIRNQSGQDGKASVVMDLSDGITPATMEPTSIELKNGATAVVDVPLQFSKTGDARVAWTATLKTADASFDDALAVAVSVGSPMVSLRETYFPALDSKSTNLVDGINPQLREGTGTVSIAVANTRLVGVGESARHLLDYPFGCAEQTLSKMVPWSVRALNPLMPDLARSNDEILAEVDSEFTRLSTMQTSQGGIGFWPGSDSPSLFASAWAGVVFGMLEQAEIPAPKVLTAPLITFLSNSLRAPADNPTPDDWINDTLSLYALSLLGKAEPAFYDNLLEISGSLPEDARCLLALAMHQTGNATNLEDARDLMMSRSTSSPTFSVFGSPSRSLAIRLIAMATILPESPSIAPLLAELLQSRRNGTWGNTQADAWALLALNAYYTQIEIPASNHSKIIAGAIIAPEKTTPFELTQSAPAMVVSTQISPTTAADGILVNHESTGAIYAETTFVVTPPLGKQPRQNRGFGVSRSYQKIDAAGKLGPISDLRVGDRVLVTLRVECTQPAFFVAIQDPLPAILEAVNPDFQSKSAGYENVIQGPVSFREIRSNNVRFFADNLSAGTFVFQYLTRVRVAGTANAGATKVEEMYRPDHFGLGEIEELTSIAAE